MFVGFVKKIVVPPLMSKPNIILVFTDNQQASTLGCYGNDEVKTPNIDRLAGGGVRMRNAFCANAFCSPCRASLLTGMMPSQHGVHSWIDDRNMSDWPDDWHALRGLSTLPEIMQGLGYRTGLFGKYHLGQPTTAAPGWDSWVTMADGHVRSFYDNQIFDNGDTYQQPGHSVDFFTDEALDFIADGSQPYFAYIPLPAPYGHWPATNDGNRNRHAGLYDDCPMHSVPREGLSAAAVRGYDRAKAGSGKGLDFSMVMRAPNHLPTYRNYYSQITMIDDAVGRLVAADPDALIIFTTDHGLSLGQHGFWGHGGATFPSNLHRAAHSIPMIFGGGPVTGGGRTDDRFVSNTDLFATVVDIAGGTPDRQLPSRSLAHVLGGEMPADWGDDAVFAEQEETRVVRTGNWVYFRRFGGGAPVFGDELYDVGRDPGETTDLIDDPDCAAIATRLAAQIDAYFSTHARPAANMWTGGRPIQNTMVPAFWKRAWGDDWAPVYTYEDA